MIVQDRCTSPRALRLGERDPRELSLGDVKVTLSEACTQAVQLVTLNDYDTCACLVEMSDVLNSPQPQLATTPKKPDTWQSATLEGGL